MVIIALLVMLGSASLLTTVAASSVDPGPPPVTGGNSFVREDLQRARAAVQRGDGLAALRKLPFDVIQLPREHAVAALTIQAEAEILVGRTLDAIATVNRLGAIEPEGAMLSETKLRQHLLTLDPQSLNELLRRSHHPSTRSWIEPLLGTTANKSARSARPALADHRINDPAKIAVLLPLGGRYDDAAKSILSGIAASHASLRADQPVQLLILDTGADDSAAVERYQDAVRANVDRVIGPLSREATAKLARHPELPVLLIALNDIESGTGDTTRMFRIALDPESEARQLAAETLRAGYQSAWILAADSSLGKRLEQAFTKTFEAGRARVAGRIVLATSDTDFRRPLAALPDADMRNDDSLVFLAMQPAQARMVWPQLRYLGHGHRAVWATSHVFEGYPDPFRDADLDGLGFLEMPGLVDGRLTDREDMGAVWPRLFALGHDAFQVAMHLGELYRDGQEYAGLTGTLRVRSDRRVDRDLSWARFVEGRPEPEPGAFALRSAKDRPIP